MIRQNQVIMMVDRGYSITRVYDLNNQTNIRETKIFQGELVPINSQNNLSVYHKRNAPDILVGFLLDVETLTKSLSRIRNYWEDNDEDQPPKIILIVSDVVGSKKVINQFREESIYMKVQVIPEYLLMRNIPKNPLQPLMHVMSEEEIDAMAHRLFLFKNNVRDLSGLPKIQVGDPLSVWYGFEVGQVIAALIQKPIPHLITEAEIVYYLVIPDLDVDLREKVKTSEQEIS